MQTSALHSQPVVASVRRSSLLVARPAWVFRAGPTTWQRAPQALRSNSSSRAVRPVVAQAAEDKSSADKSVKYNTEFGYSRKDVILIGAGIIGLGYGLYYGLQATGMDAGMAGNWVQLIIILGMSVGWVGSYLFRVATKNMTYVKQLEEYEEAVMAKRLAEMPEAEVERMLEEVEGEKERRAAARAARQQQQQQGQQ